MKVIFSRHAIDRIHQYKLFISDAERRYKESKPYELPVDLILPKWKRYGLTNVRAIKYRIYEEYLFTIRTLDSGDVLIITFTKMKNDKAKKTQ